MLKQQKFRSYQKLVLVWLLLVLACSQLSIAQISLNSGGYTGLGVNPSNLYRLYVSCGTACGSGTKAGTYVSVVAGSGTTLNYGVYSNVTGSAATSYGVRGYAGGNGTNYGIHGSAGSGGGSNYGGYFTQGIYVSGGITQASDERLKTNIKDINTLEILQKIQQIRTIEYEFLNTDMLKQRGLPTSHFDVGVHYGFSAQNVEVVFPELVSEVIHTITSTDINDSDAVYSVTTKAVDYQGITVLLMTVVKEQQRRIEALERLIKSK